MDACEATKVVMSRIRELDPENASKIVGHILLQGQGEKEVIRLAFAPESLLKSCINQAKTFLGIPSTTYSETSTPLSSTTLQRTSPRMLNLLHFNNHSASFSRKGSRPISYAEVVNGSNVPGSDFTEEQLYGTGGVLESQSSDHVLDSVATPSGGNDSLVFPYAQSLHRFSNSENENGERLEMRSPVVDSSGFDEFLRLKALQQQQRSAFLPSGSPHHVLYKNTNFLDENQRGDLSCAGLPTRAISSSRQIYLTFPPDSVFKEEDVASYFSTFGPVQGVRIPYQQRRMFGFVTFVDPETVKTILAKGNPHFIRDARVLVKPYKEKGKMLDKKELPQQRERGDYYSGLSSSGNDSVEQLDIPFGPRMLNGQEKILHRKFEDQVDSRNAIEFESQRMMNMQLLDWQDQNHDFDSPSSFPATVSTGYPRWTEFLMRLNSVAPPEASQEFGDGQALPGSSEFSSNNEHQHNSYTNSFSKCF